MYADYKASVLCGLWNHLTFVIDVRLVRGSTLDMLQNVKQLWDISPNQSITEVCMEKKQVPSDFKQVLEQFTYLAGLVMYGEAGHADIRGQESGDRNVFAAAVRE